MAPNSPQQLRDRLFTIFPRFKVYWEDEDNAQVENGAFTYHGLMTEFMSFFTVEVADLSEKQLKAFAEIANAAIAQPGVLENAVSTCFLEHLRHVRADRALAPYLSAAAKAKSHA